MEALVAMNISESEIIPDAKMEERVLWIQKSKRQALFVANDSIKGASNVLHLGSRRLRVAAAEKLMTALKSKNIDSNCAYQGAVVIATRCPWLLRRELFKVGLCYHGQFGDYRCLPVGTIGPPRGMLTELKTRRINSLGDCLFS